MRFSFGDPQRHTGMCDASCGVALPGPRFLAADDEADTLSLYEAAQGGPPLAVIDLGGVLGASGELDVEGSARIGDLVWWVASHGRDAHGGKAPWRRRLFATELEGERSLHLAGDPYHGLIDDLDDDPRYARFDLRKAARQAPKEKGGLNVEGLAADDAGALLVGFRSPLVDGRALIAVVEKPERLLRGKKPRFGAPMLLDLGGLGIRSVEHWPERNALIVVAGPSGAARGGPFEVHVIPVADLRSAHGAERVPVPEGLNPEGVLTWPGERGQFLLLSDDGAVDRDGGKCKDLAPGDPGRYFRSVWVHCG
jgi:hypothetical protein